MDNSVFKRGGKLISQNFSLKFNSAITVAGEVENLGKIKANDCHGIYSTVVGRCPPGP